MVERATKAKKQELAGLIYSLIATLFNSAGSLFAEKFMKNAAATPFPTQKSQMETTGFPVALLMSFLVPLAVTRDPKGIWWTTVKDNHGNEVDGSGGGFFRGYSRLTVIAIAMDIGLAWMGGIIAKKFSSVTKLIAKCFVLLLTVFITGTFPPFKKCEAQYLPPNMYFLACIVFAGTLLFSAPSPPPPPPALPPAQSSLPDASHGEESQVEMGHHTSKSKTHQVAR
jgi:hypothetical protein